MQPRSPYPPYSDFNPSLVMEVGEVAATLPVVFGQQVNVDLWTNVKSTWNNLLETGQLWAFLIGLGMGWWAKSLLP